MNITAILKQMTLEEKAALSSGASPWSTTPIERLGLPAMVVSDGPHGVRRVADANAIASQSLPATCFPTASCLGATWDVDLLFKMGQALGEEAIALGVDVLLGPGVNMKRSPLGGRNFEYYSEDPYLSGELASGFINGIQSKGVGTSVKHFAANNQEFQRFSINAEVDERTLREIYLPAFETSVKKAHPWTVMCAYNKLNGTYCSEHADLLINILKEEWGFDGLVVSDWGAVHDRVKSLQGGLDLEMPGPQDRRVRAVIDAVKFDKLDESILDESVRRILGVIGKASETPKGGEYNQDAHHNLARQIAAEGMVLLKNNGILPLHNPQHIVVIGRSAEQAHFQGGGSSHVNPTKVAVPFQELQKQVGGAELTYAEGYPADQSFRQDLIDQAVELSRSAEVALLYIALPGFKESEGYDRDDLDLTPQQVALIKAVTQVQPQTVVILNNGAPVAMNEWITGTAAVLEAWMMGQAGGEAIADVLYGRVNPCGKLAETFPCKLADNPSYLNFPGENGQVRYGEGLFIGYRYYDAVEKPVLFPFGYGLSYTTFAYSNLRLSASTFKDIDGLIVFIDVTNTGNLAGKEIVQVYVHDQVAGLRRPPKELKGFAKVELQPGETKTVQIALDFRAFAFYHPAYKQWITEDGSFDILVGASAVDIRCTAVANLQSTLQLPCVLNRESTIREWLSDPQGRMVLEPFFQQVVYQQGGLFEGVESDSTGMDMLNFFQDLPLLSLLNFQQQTLSQSAEELVDDLIVKVVAMNPHKSL